MMSVAKFILDTSQGLIDKLPDQLQRIILLPSIRKGLAVLAALQFLRSFNSYLSRGAQNNWVRLAPWDPSKELVVLTGGCSGIGKQILADLTNLKVKVIILDVKEPTFALPANATFYQADITSSSILKEVAGKIRKEHGNPTILINNAGVADGGTILEKSEESIRLTMDVNLLSHFWTVREFLPSMIQKDHGHIITIASATSFITIGQIADYTCSKAAAVAFHEGLTQELKYWYKSKKIRTSIVHPFWVRTPMIDDMIKAGHKFGEPIMSTEEVSSAIVKQITSQNGGQLIVPNSHAHITLLRALPCWIQERVRDGASKNFVRLRELQDQMKTENRL